MIRPIPSLISNYLYDSNGRVAGWDAVFSESPKEMFQSVQTKVVREVNGLE